MYRICLSTCSTDTWLPKPQSVFSIRSLTLCTFVSVLGSDKNVIGHCGLKKHINPGDGASLNQVGCLKTTVRLYFGLKSFYYEI